MSFKRLWTCSIIKKEEREEKEEWEGKRKRKKMGLSFVTN
jgi:hypothetical protein